MSEQLGIGQIIKNFLGIGDDDKEPSGAVSSSLRPKARPEGLMSSPRPRARPEDTDDDDTPSTNEDVVTNTITMMNDYDDSEEEDGVPLDSANIQELLINPNSLYDRHSTTIRRLSRFGNEVPTVMKQKLRSPVVNDLLVDVTAMLAKEQSANRPTEEPEFIDVPKPIPVTLNNREIQEKLVDAGYNITVDGVVGPQTKKAIKAFQKEKGLKVDGVVGKNTTAALAGVPEITSETIKAGEVIYDDDFLAQQELASGSAGLMSPIITEPTTEELTEKQTVAVNEAAILGFPISIADIIPAHFKQFVGSVTGSAVNDVKTEDFESIIQDILNGKFEIEDRNLVSASFLNETVYGLNEIVIHSGAYTQLMRYRLSVNNKVVYEQRSDGLIVATPTGSTAYSLSAGGPIIHPSLDVWTILPMLPQSLSSRPFIISSDENVEMELFEGPNDSAKICVDGQDDIDVSYGVKISISKMKKTLKLVHPEDNDFFEACREKLGWSLNISKN